MVVAYREWSWTGKLVKFCQSVFPPLKVIKLEKQELMTIAHRGLKVKVKITVQTHTYSDIRTHTEPTAVPGPLVVCIL